MAWVIIAFAFTVANSFTDVVKDFNSDGQGVGFLWLWLIPIVVEWLWIPFSSYNKPRTAIDKANDLAIVAASDDPPRLGLVSRTHPMQTVCPTLAHRAVHTTSLVFKRPGCPKRWRCPPKTLPEQHQCSTMQESGSGGVPSR